MKGNGPRMSKWKVLFYLVFINLEEGVDEKK